MKKKLLACASLLAALPATSLAVPTVYSYSGTPYVTIQEAGAPPGSYTTAMNLQGSITLFEAIAPNTVVNLDFNDTNIMSFTFNDGRIEYTKENTTGVTSWGVSRFRFYTGSSGNVFRWEFTLNRVGPAPGITHSFMQSSLCTSSQCDTVYAFDDNDDVAVDGAISKLRGTWTVTPIPEPATYALFLAGIALVGFAAKRRMRLPS